MKRMNITVQKSDMEQDLDTIHTTSVREKVLQRLLGYKRRVTVLIPGERILNVRFVDEESENEAIRP